MRALGVVLGVGVAAATVFGAAAQPEPAVGTIKFLVMRDGDQIGTTTVRLSHEGRETVAEIKSHIQVKLAFITVYRFDQTEVERWADGQLVSLAAVTDDNGTHHKVSATTRGNKLLVDADGKASEVDRSLMPASLWNAALVQKTQALNLQDGTVIKVSVVDHGDEQVDVKGTPTKTRHYSINMSFPQDVWYDQNRQLVKVKMRATDGSKIEYQPG